MLYGQQYESVAKSMFMQQYNKIVRPSGLFIDEEFGFLAGSPDGKFFIYQTSILSLCLANVAKHNTSYNLLRVTKNNQQ